MYLNKTIVNLFLNKIDPIELTYTWLLVCFEDNRLRFSFLQRIIDK
jgi:hypothetical protein